MDLNNYLNYITKANLFILLTRITTLLKDNTFSKVFIGCFTKILLVKSSTFKSFFYRLITYPSKLVILL